MGRRSLYAFQVNSAGALVHVAWGPVPEGAEAGPGLTAGIERENHDITFDYDTRPDELVAFAVHLYYRLTPEHDVIEISWCRASRTASRAPAIIARALPAC